MRRSSEPQPELGAAIRAVRVERGLANAYDAAAARIVLFGGENGSPLGDTWTYDGSDWTQASSTSSPPAREGATLADAPAAGQLVLFGGEGELGLLNDTWKFDGSAWTQQSPPTSPFGRASASSSYDAATGRVLLFGGFRFTESPGGELGDTWTYGVYSPMVSAPTGPTGGTPVSSPPAGGGAPTMPPTAPTCTVPRLLGKKLKGAKKRIRAADCSVGKVNKKKGATAGDGKVAKESPKPGSEVPVGTKVKVTLAPPAGKRG